MTQETMNKVIQFRDDRNWRQFHNPKDLAISLSLEASELLEVFQWSGEDLTCEGKMDKIREELADVLSYCILMADVCGLDMDEIVQAKVKKNAEKYPVEKAYGNKAKYTELKESARCAESRENSNRASKEKLDISGLNHCYDSLMEIEDVSLRKEAFEQIEDKYSDVYLYNGTDVLEVASNYLQLRLKGPITIEGNKCKLPMEYWCTDSCGDLWQNIGIYDDDDLRKIDRMDYMNSLTDTIFEVNFWGEDFLIVRLDTSCDVETSHRDGMIMVGIDVSSAQVRDFSSFYKEMILDNEADWNEILVQSYEIEIAGKRFLLDCEKVDTQYVYLSLDRNQVVEMDSFMVSDLLGAQIIINIQKDHGIESYSISLPLSDTIEYLGHSYLSLPHIS